MAISIASARLEVFDPFSDFKDKSITIPHRECGAYFQYFWLE